MRLSIEIEARDGNARTGVVTTHRGSFRTPVFMPVGTRGTIRAVPADSLERLGPEIMLANNYHLMLRPGAERVEALGGLHRFMGWPSHLLTDSGGYQVFSLEPKVSEDGVTFRSVYDGSAHHLTPEGAVKSQELIGADIQMVLDICSPLPSERPVLKEAVALTARWAQRAKVAHRRRDDQALFGIVQGGIDSDLRRESAERTVEIGFDGYAVGGLSVGEPLEEMLPALEVAAAHLPVDQPRYLMGVGDPLSIVEGVARGVDMFDCVLPTRLGRHGTILTDSGRVNVKRAEFATSTDPLEPGCPCPTCERHSRGFVRHLLAVGEPVGGALCSVHNLAWLLRFVDRVRAAIVAGEMEGLRTEVMGVWGGATTSSS